MSYELHITVEKHPNPEQIIAFSFLCQEMCGKALLIALSSGEFPLQLMLARKNNLPCDELAINWANDQAALLKQLKWDVVRVKVESIFSPRTWGTPTTAVYNEAHWKMYLLPEQTIHLLNWLSLHPELEFKHSWNVIEEGVNYLTIRSMDSDLQKVKQLFIDRNEVLIQAGFPSKKVHYERVLFDNNIELDNGWCR